MNKTFKILEMIWLFMGCVGVFMCIYSFAIQDNRGGIYFLVFFLVCGMMYYVRKRQRIKFGQQPQAGDAEKPKDQIK
ncbi:MAG: hypothetical protein V4608_16155 [Bacteroidota bacterium]